MPNKRKKGKNKMNFWLDDLHRDMLAQLSKLKGLNMTEMVEAMIVSYASYHGIVIYSPEVERAMEEETRKNKKENKEK